MTVAALLLTFKTLQSGSYANRTATAPQMIVARDAVTTRNVWQQGVAPAIDFKKQSVVFLFAGQKMTGGFSIVVKSVKRHGKDLVIDAHIEGPQRGSMVTQALTSPFVAIAVPNVKAMRVKWVDGAQVIAEERK